MPDPQPENTHISSEVIFSDFYGWYLQELWFCKVALLLLRWEKLSEGHWVGMCLMFTYTSRGLKVLIRTTPLHTHTWLWVKQIYHPDSSQTLSDTTTLTASICQRWELQRCFICILVLHLHIEIYPFPCRIKSLGSIENIKQSFNCTSAHICNPTAPPLGPLSQLLWPSKENKCESKDVYRQQANMKCSGDVLEDTLLGRQHKPQVYYLLDKQTYAFALICLRLICLPFKSISSITSRATAPRVLLLYYAVKPKHSSFVSFVYNPV